MLQISKLRYKEVRNLPVYRHAELESPGGHFTYLFFYPTQTPT